MTDKMRGTAERISGSRKLLRDFVLAHGDTLAASAAPGSPAPVESAAEPADELGTTYTRRGSSIWGITYARQVTSM